MRLVVPVPAGDPLALLDPTRVLQDVLLGAGFGAVLARIVVHRMERRRGELSARQIRELEVRWTCALSLAGVVLSLVFRVA
jgi:hypothetical protein